MNSFKKWLGRKGIVVKVAVQEDVIISSLREQTVMIQIVLA